MASPQYADLTRSNYDEAYHWIVETGLINELISGIPSPLRVLNAAFSTESSGLGDIALEGLPSPGFLPVPLLDASRALDIPDVQAWKAALAANYKIDLERRSRIGALGERALFQLLETAGCSVYHGSIESDALGWDIMASHSDVTKHIEVKSTTSIARLRIYLSRHEYEVSSLDPEWLLVVVLITEGGRLERFAHVHPEVLRQVVPVDRPNRGKWQVCSIDLQHVELIRGLPFDCVALPQDGVVTASTAPVWWPTT